MYRWIDRCLVACGLCDVDTCRPLGLPLFSFMSYRFSNFRHTPNRTSCPKCHLTRLSELVFAKLSSAAFVCHLLTVLVVVAIHFLFSCVFFVLWWFPWRLKGVNFITRLYFLVRQSFCILFFALCNCVLCKHLFLLFFNFTRIKSNLICQKKNETNIIWI